MDWPKYGLRCIPERNPSTMCRARISSRAMRLIASGCKNLFEPGIAGELVFLGGERQRGGTGVLATADRKKLGCVLIDLSNMHSWWRSALPTRLTLFRKTRWK